MKNLILNPDTVYVDWRYIHATIIQKMNMVDGSLILPTSIDVETLRVDKKEVKTLFGNKQIKDKPVYQVVMKFTRDLTEEEILKWKIFVHGMRLGNNLRASI